MTWAVVRGDSFGAPTTMDAAGAGRRTSSTVSTIRRRTSSGRDSREREGAGRLDGEGDETSIGLDGEGDETSIVSDGADMGARIQKRRRRMRDRETPRKVRQARGGASSVGGNSVGISNWARP